MNNNTKIVGFIIAAMALVFALRIHELNAKSDYDSMHNLAREAKLLTKNFSNDDTKLHNCRSLSDTPTSENVTDCIEKVVESNDRDLALLNKIN